MIDRKKCLKKCFTFRFIKMSSPNMNNMIIVGSFLTYTSVILLGLDTRVLSDRGFEIMCAAKTWIFCFGFTLAFGSMFSKTWRVHSIFTNIKLNKKVLIKFFNHFLFNFYWIFRQSEIINCSLLLVSCCALMVLFWSFGSLLIPCIWKWKIWPQR